MKTKLNGFLTLLLALAVQITFAQEKTVTGVVSDASGPLPGVTVLIKGTTKGTQTDFDGKYSIKAKQGDVLHFNYMGMKDVFKNVGSSSVINVTMQEDSEALSEVVVTAMGIKTKAKSLGYSQQSVKGDDLNKTRQTDITTALAGKVSGIQFTGQPTSTFKASDVRLRGSSGILYVVDGVKLNSRTDVNTEEIETMTVLKGLAATAIYGPDGKNGAIVITTKRAKNGESTIEYNTSIDLSNVYVMPEYQNEYGGGYANDGKPKGHPERYTSGVGYFTTYNGQKIPTYSADESWGPKLDGTLVRHWDSWIEGDAEYGKLRPWSANPNNVKNFYQTGVRTNNSVSFSKGGEDYSIRSSVSHIGEELILENTKRETIKTNINANYNLTEKLKFNMNVSYTNRFTKNDPDNNYGNLGSNFNQWWQRQLDMDRLKNYKRNGKIVSWNILSPTNSKPLYWDSPYFEVYENIKEQVKNGVYGQVAVTYDIMDDLSANVAFKKTYNQYNFNDRAGWGGLNSDFGGKPWYREGTWSEDKSEIFGILNYAKDLGDFSLKSNLGFEIGKYDYRYFSTNTVGGMTAPGFYSISSSKDRPATSSNLVQTRTRGWFTKLSAGYKDYLFLEGTYRMDFGSTADPENNSVVTKGLSGSFVFTELLPKNDILSFGKLRVGYAEAPTFPRAYQLSQVYGIGTPYGSTGLSSVPNRGVNPTLKGGVREEVEYGAEFRFINNRITLDVNYFQRKDNELPSSVTVPGSTGITSFFSNQGRETAKGFEVSLSGAIIKTENFRWDLAVNAATLERTVDYIADNVDVNVLSSWGPRLEAHKGERWGSIYGNGYKLDDKGNRILNRNGLYEFESNKYLGSILPDLTGGLTTNLRYKNIDLSLGFDYQFGGKFYGVTRRYGNFAGLGIETVGNNALGNPVRNTIQGTGDHASYSVNLKNAASTSGGHLTSGVDADGNPQQFLVNPFVLWRNNLRNIHEEYVNDATYVKLRTVRIGYTLEKDVLKGTPFKSINLGLFANNVWLMMTDIKGIDPSETEGRSGYNWIENGQLPSARTVGLNAKFTF